MKKKINKEYFGFLDEYALVTALKDMGIVFSRRTPDSAIINFVNKLNFIFFCKLIFWIFISEVK